MQSSGVKLLGRSYDLKSAYRQQRLRCEPALDENRIGQPVLRADGKRGLHESHQGQCVAAPRSAPCCLGRRSAPMCSSAAPPLSMDVLL